jgi:hypothetical protein
MTPEHNHVVVLGVAWLCMTARFDGCHPQLQLSAGGSGVALLVRLVVTEDCMSDIGSAGCAATACATCVSSIHKESSKV